MTLAWDQSPDASVTGYNLYFGDVSGSSTNTIDVGNGLTYVVPGLTETKTYFFFLTAYNASRIESVPSNRIEYTVPASNTPPTVSAIQDQAIAANTTTGPISFVIGDVQTPAANLTLDRSSSNSGLVPTNNIVFGGSGATRTVTVTPTASQAGAATITISVSDGQSTVTSSFVVTVTPPNSPPTISGIADRAINENTSTGPLSFAVNDAETAAANLTLTKGSSNPGLVPANNIVFGGSGTARTVAVTPATNQTGNTTITVGVSDGQITVTTSFVVTITPVNSPPTISGIADRTINENTSTGPLSLTVNDAETAAASLTLTRSSSNPVLVPANNIVFGGSGAARTVTVTPAANQTGSATITVGVSDGQSAVTTSFVVTVTPVNNPPTISGIADRTINENTSTGSISFTVGDAETAAASLTLTKGSSNPGLVPINNIVFGGSGTARTVTVTPAADQTGSTTITVGVSDGQTTVTTNFVVTVTPVNSPPIISSIAATTINEDTSTGPLSFTVSDAETAAASLTLTKGSSNPGLVPANNIVFGGSGTARTVTVTPAAGQAGTATITISVSDGQSTVTTSFVVTVTPVNDPPTISSIAGQTITGDTSSGPINFTVSDAETAAGSLTLTKDSSNPGLIPVNNIVFGGSGTARTVTVTPAAGQTGSAIITVTVSDGSLSAAALFAVTVTPALPTLIYAPLEAESAALVSPMVTSSNIDASQSLFISSSANNSGTATFSINLPRSDTYVIWCRTLSPDSSVDSFFVSVDGGAEINYTTAQDIWTDTWQWTLVNDSDTGVNPQAYPLSAGPHNIVFRGRESGTALDQILVTNDRSFIPDVDTTSLAPNRSMLPLALNPNGSATLSWQSIPGKVYRVQYKTSLADPLWTILKPDVVATDTTTSRSDYLTGNRFYTVTELP